MNQKNATNHTTAAKRHISLTVDETVFERIEKECGLVPRAIFVNEKLKGIFRIREEEKKRSEQENETL